MSNASLGVRFELKYCEVCGSLLVRPCGSQAVYCAWCEVRIGQIARRSAPRPDGKGKSKAILPQLEGCIGIVPMAMATDGGWS
jgi:hypothetical protein